MLCFCLRYYSVLSVLLRHISIYISPPCLTYWYPFSLPWRNDCIFHIHFPSFTHLLMTITMLIIHPQYPHCYAPIYPAPCIIHPTLCSLNPSNPLHFITISRSMHGYHPHIPTSTFLSLHHAMHPEPSRLRMAMHGHILPISTPFFKLTSPSLSLYYTFSRWKTALGSFLFFQTKQRGRGLVHRRLGLRPFREHDVV